MPGSSTTLHEERAQLSESAVDMHRALASLMEELEAVDWYAQRVEATADEALAAVLAHNRDEEKEHAAMTLEWIRRRDPTFDAHLRSFLFREGPISEHGHEEDEAADPGDGSLGIGSLRATAAR